MSIISKLFGRKSDEQQKAGGMEDFMTLVRVYFQAVMASDLGITNLAALPDLRVFKQTYHVTTLNNKLGLGEKKNRQKLIEGIYGVSEGFFKEIDASVKKHCRTMRDVQPYLLQFQGFNQVLMMLMGNLMQWKFRLPGFMRKALKGMVDKQVHEIMTGNNWKDEGVRKAVVSVRRYQAQLGYSEQWMSEFVHTIVMLAKKEKPTADSAE